ncbi:MAG: hypothetical protein ACHQ7M_09590, partial [Chloroflexota bacterium]
PQELAIPAPRWSREATPDWRLDMNERALVLGLVWGTLGGSILGIAGGLAVAIAFPDVAGQGGLFGAGIGGFLLGLSEGGGLGGFLACIFVPKA